MTLAELLPVVEQLPAADKLKLIRILAEALDDSCDIAPLVPHEVYELPTPYGMQGAAKSLLEYLEKAESSGT
jgi:hypothetical protein